MINAFDRSNLGLINEEIKTALKAIAEKHGVKLGGIRISFSPQNAGFRFDLSTVSENGVVNDRYRQSFIANAFQYGLEASDLDKTFSYGGKTYTITGLNTRRHSRPIITKRSDGMGTVFPAAAVKTALMLDRAKATATNAQ